MHLVKRWILVASPVNVRVAREAILGSGEVWRVEEADEGAGCSKIVSGCVVGGKPEAEVSWKVDGAFKVEASMHVTMDLGEVLICCRSILFVYASSRRRICTFRELPCQHFSTKR